MSRGSPSARCRHRRGERNRECHHLCSVLGEVQHQAQGSMQILLESVEAFQFAGSGARAWPWETLKIVCGKVTEHFGKQNLKYRSRMCWTLGKSASEVFVKCRLKEFAQAYAGRLPGCIVSRDPAKLAWQEWQSGAEKLRSPLVPISSPHIFSPVPQPHAPEGPELSPPDGGPACLQCAGHSPASCPWSSTITGAKLVGGRRNLPFSILFLSHQPFPLAAEERTGWLIQTGVFSFGRWHLLRAGRRLLSHGHLHRGWDR